MWRVTFLTAFFTLGLSGIGTGTLLVSPVRASTPAILQAMELEIERTMTTLADQPDPPYFLSYEITETHGKSLQSSFGTDGGRTENRTRLLDIDLRVGDYQLDNTHQVRGDFEGFGFRRGFSYVPIPLDDEVDAIRTILWHRTDAKYKKAKELLTRIKTNVQVKVEEEDKSADFSREEPARYLEEPVSLALDEDIWREKIKRYTAPFSAHGEIYQAQAVLQAQTRTRWHASSEGTRLRTSQPAYRLFISAVTKADDGMELPRYESFFARDLDDLPGDEAVLAAVGRMIADLLALREAPVVDPYTGPAILAGRASGVFFHEIFGHRVEGHRQKKESDGQTFKKKIGQRVLPSTFDVVFDPTLKTFGSRDLAGFYRFDNQGIVARRVSVVEDGNLERFLMSRSPIEGFSHSNGHGRGQPGYAPVARQSNLLVHVRDAVSPAELKAQLIERLLAEGKPYGLRFEDIQGGFTLTGRTIPNAFNVLPILVYKVYPDGREELVRGVDLIGTPLTAFSKILAADTDIGVFNGTCGAESGGVPVSAASPGILVAQIEVQKKSKSQERAPILPAPLAPTPFVADGSEGGR